MRWLVNFGYLFGLLIGSPYFLLRMMTAGKYRRGLWQRFGAVPKPASTRPVIWLHAVSVGEAQLAKPLIDGLRARHPECEIVVSHITRTAEDVTAKLYPDLVRFYFPLDFSWVVSKVMRRINPRLIVLVELELWPNFLMEARRRGIPVLLANGRISEKSALGYGRNAWFFRRAFAAVTRALVQNDEYAGRMRALLSRMTLDPAAVTVAGNIKYDNVAAVRDKALRDNYRNAFGVGDSELLLVCGSTHPGEHEELVRLYREWREASLNLRMVVVPRHPERWHAVRDLWKRSGIPMADRSALSPERPLAAWHTDQSGLPPCVLFDVMGELGKLYHAADLVFVGGSLIPHGGQNMIEPAGLGLPVLYGPHTKNFKSTVRDLAAASAAIEVKDSAALGTEIAALCRDEPRRRALGNAAREVIAQGRGATTRHLDTIDELLAPRH